MFTHMNNSRYLREYDFARFDLATRNGIMDELMARGGSFPVSAISVRYRLPLMMFSTYKVYIEFIRSKWSLNYLQEYLSTLNYKF
jgi:acyl-CoA thioesterase FadM